jgi:hypothetical protein
VIHTLETQQTGERAPSVLMVALPPDRPGGEASMLLLPADRAAEVCIHRNWHRKDVKRHVPAETSDVHVQVQVNDSRWLVQCPLCRSAQVASVGDRRFFCVDCLNAHVQGRWIVVDWPANADEIEAELVKRPLPHTRGWTAEQTVADLQRENLAHAVG